MQLCRVLSAALLVTVITTGIGSAQITQSAKAPAEVPPADFKQRQFVDSSGCVFVRASIGGKVSWVPRVTRDRQPVCGAEPTVLPPSTTAAVTVPDSGTKPAKEAAQAAAVATAVPAKHRAPKTSSPSRQVRMAQATTVAAEPTPEQINRAALLVYAVPKGYKRSWDDGRLNPNRGPRTAAGDAQMRRLWTDDVPRKLVEIDTAAAVAAIEARQARISSKSVHPKQVKRAQKASAPAGALYVQVGTYSVPANIKTATSRLQRLGLPVRHAVRKTGGKTYRTVMAGPFASSAQAASALNAAKAAGFPDAKLRK